MQQTHRYSHIWFKGIYAKNATVLVIDVFKGRNRGSAARIYHSQNWVRKMSDIMESMNTSSGLSFSLSWSSKRAESEDQLDTRRLAIFSSDISKNPHCFDMDSDCGRLHLYGIAYIFSMTVPQNAEERAELLYDAGIIIDEISNTPWAAAFWHTRTAFSTRAGRGFMKRGSRSRFPL